MSRQTFKEILFLQDISVLKHPAYSPALAPVDYCLFSGVKKHFKGRKLLRIEEATLAADGWY
jgi:hypothetical protein